jgi:hypothetical protein
MQSSSGSPFPNAGWWQVSGQPQRNLSVGRHAQTGMQFALVLLRQIVVAVFSLEEAEAWARLLSDKPWLLFVIL